MRSTVVLQPLPIQVFVLLPTSEVKWLHQLMIQICYSPKSLIGSTPKLKNRLQELLTRGAETILAVLGLTSVVSTVCHYIGAFFHLILTSGSTNAQDEEEKSGESN